MIIVDGHADVNDHREERHSRPGRLVVTVLEELRNSVDARSQEPRQEDEGHHDQSNGRHPFVARDGQSDVVGRLPRHADELLRGDVRGDEGEADQPPAQATSGEEIGLAVLLMTALDDSDGDDRHDEGQENDHVEGKEFHESRFLSL
jgi:hypothetical protein